MGRRKVPRCFACGRRLKAHQGDLVADAIVSALCVAAALWNLIYNGGAVLVLTLAGLAVAFGISTVYGAATAGRHRKDCKQHGQTADR